jgi:hypothetical protein
VTGWLVPAALAAAVASGIRGTWSPCGLSMVSAINPLSERSRGNRYWITALWFVAGALAGGAVLGAGTALLAAAVHPLAGHQLVTAAAAGLAGLVAVAADRRVGGFRLPLHPRQVNELWLMQYRRWCYAAGFGAQIGAGFATYIMTAATYLLVALGALTGSPRAAFGAGLAFGLVRGSAVLLSARCRSAGALRQLHLRLSRLQGSSMLAVIAVEVGIVLAAGVAAGRETAAGATGGAAASLALCAALLAPPVLAGRRPVRSPSRQPG